jgi:class 3 adenylate cyclase
MLFAHARALGRERVSVRRLLFRIVQDLKPVLEAAPEIELRVMIGAGVDQAQLDPTQFSVALKNLIQNSVEALGSGDQPNQQIEVRVERTETHELQVAVWDGSDADGQAIAGTGADIRRWRGRGGNSLVIDSLDPQATPRRLPASNDCQRDRDPGTAWVTIPATPAQHHQEKQAAQATSAALGSPSSTRPLRGTNRKLAQIMTKAPETNTSATKAGDSPTPPPLPTRQLRAFLFGDIKGFTQLREAQLPVFQQQVMGAFAAVLDEFNGSLLYRNTWGDALYVVFDQVAGAADCAVRLQEVLAALPLARLHLPENLSLRIGMHYGPVYEDRDQVLRTAVYYGTEVSRAARIEPITPPGEIYATEAFAAALAFDAGEHFCADYVGRVQTAKNYGEFRMYHIRRTLGG